MIRRGALLLAFALLGGVLLYASNYFTSTRGDAFQYVRQVIQDSPTIEAKIGKVVEISLDASGPYHERFAGANERATMAVRVKGAKGEAIIYIEVAKAHGNWSVENVSVDGQAIQLD